MLHSLDWQRGPGATHTATQILYEPRHAIVGECKFFTYLYNIAGMEEFPKKDPYTHKCKFHPGCECMWVELPSCRNSCIEDKDSRPAVLPDCRCTHYDYRQRWNTHQSCKPWMELGIGGEHDQNGTMNRWKCTRISQKSRKLSTFTNAALWISPNLPTCSATRASIRAIPILKIECAMMIKKVTILLQAPYLLSVQILPGFTDVEHSS